MSLLIALTSAALAGPGGTIDCGFLALVQDEPMPPLAEYDIRRGEDLVLANRDYFGVQGSAWESEHFQVLYGDDVFVSTAWVERLLSAFELAWQVQVEQMGHVRPWGTDTYRMNVYIGNTGDGAPTISGASGYATVDGDGFPYVVIHPDTVALYDQQGPEAAWADGVMVHEFYHTIQTTLATWPYWDDTGWYWEATANWVVHYVLPGDNSVSASVATYAMLPQYPVYWFDYPDTGTFIEARHYGAQVFPLFLTRDVADQTLVVDSWMYGHGTDTPLDYFDTALAEWGTDLDTEFADFAARTVDWDMTGGSVYANWLEVYQGWFPMEDDRFVDVIDDEGTDGWVDAPMETRPYAYGYNIVRMPFPDAGELTVRFDGDDEGSTGSWPDWHATLVARSFEGSTYLPFELDDDGAGEVALDPDGVQELFLVATPLPNRKSMNERFGFRYDFDFVPAEPEVAPEDELETAGCGCGPGVPAPAPFTLFLLPLLARRRR